MITFSFFHDSEKLRDDSENCVEIEEERFVCVVGEDLKKTREAIDLYLNKQNSEESKIEIWEIDRDQNQKLRCEREIKRNCGK